MRRCTFDARPILRRMGLVVLAVAVAAVVVLALAVVLSLEVIFIELLARRVFLCEGESVVGESVGGVVILLVVSLSQKM